ncbi:MAG: hypothetical protein LDL30_00110 [Desulfovibrio sp.]|nr:hypothetical protein [Desulfovibrio sp.]MCA1985582.1 hypothetical protein [Desulfovibrio sp.]
MKYILFEDFQGRPLPIIFPDRIDHLEMREQMPYATVLSAGYVDVEGEALFRCHGKAVELGVSARAGDAAILLRSFTAENGTSSGDGGDCR